MAPLLINPKNILIIKPSSLGDVVRALPILACLRTAWPQAHIAWLIRNDLADLLKNHPQLDEIILFDRKKFARLAYSPAAAAAFLRFIKHIRNKHFDLVLDLQGLFRSAFLARVSAAPHRLGFAIAREFAPLFYTHKITIPKTEHIVDSLWRFAEHLRIDQPQKHFHLPIAPVIQKNTRSRLEQMGLEPGTPYVVFCIGAAEPEKHWPTDRFAQLADHVHNCHHLTAVLVGAGASEEQLAQQIITHAQHPLINLVGKTSLPELLALLKSAALTLGNDSGPLHLAAALNAPLIGLYGPTNPAIVGPYQCLDDVIQTAPHTPRKKRYSPHPHHRMQNISLQQVTTALDKKLPHFHH